MNHFFIIYIFLLFFFFSYQLTFLTNDFKNKTLLYCSCSFIYSVILYLSYPYFHKEGFEIEIQSKKGLQPLVDIVSKVMGNTEKSSDYKIKNEFDKFDEFDEFIKKTKSDSSQGNKITDGSKLVRTEETKYTG